MQTKFDVREVVFIPVRVIKVTIDTPNIPGYYPEYRVQPLGQNSTFTMTYLENELFTKEDIINGEAEDNGNS